MVLTNRGVAQLGARQFRVLEARSSNLRTSTIREPENRLFFNLWEITQLQALKKGFADGWSPISGADRRPLFIPKPAPVGRKRADLLRPKRSWRLFFFFCKC